VAKLDGSSGDRLWANGYGAAGVDYATSLTIDATDHVVVAGLFMDGIDFGSGVLHVPVDGQDAFLLRLEADGTFTTVKRYSGFKYQEAVFPVARSISGDGIVLGGWYMGSPNFGGGDLPASDSPAIFVVELDANLQHVASSSFPSGFVVSVDVDAEAVYLGGFTNHGVDFGLGAVGVPSVCDGCGGGAPEPYSDVVIAKLRL
jgi:hypothetical protein